MEYLTEEEIEFLDESNLIEGVIGSIALDDAIEAWKYAKGIPYEIYSLHTILDIHKLLMQRLNPQIAGKVADISRLIAGRTCRSVGVEVELQLQDWVKKYWVIKDVDTVSKQANEFKQKLEIKEAHVAFEMIHPFNDGNGRVGRILMNIQRLYYGLPILIIREGESQLDYYKWFAEKGI